LTYFVICIACIFSREVRDFLKFQPNAAMGNYEHLLPTGWKDLVKLWLAEDTPSFDYGGYVVGEKQQTAILYGKAPGVLAGVPFFNEVFEQVGCQL
jgi:nicotinate-nucleotide pyrophosphorylase (carboxylating)